MPTQPRPRFAGRPPVSTTRPMRDDRREALLTSLEGLILDQGFSELTLDEIAAHLRCSKSALYALASSKEQLVATVVRRFFREATASIDKKIAPITDPREQIAAYLAAVGDEMRRMSPACYDDMVRSPVTRDIYDVNSRAAAEHVRKAIQDGIKQKVFRPVHARFVGESVSVLIESIQHGGLLERVKLSSGDAYAELSSLVLGTLSLGNEQRTTPNRRRAVS